MDLIEKYLGEKDFLDRDLETWKKRFKHNNPYVGRWYEKPILFFHKYDPNSNEDKQFVWNGKKWMNMNNVSNPDKFTYPDQKSAVQELMRKAVPYLKKPAIGSGWKEHMKGWK